MFREIVTLISNLTGFTIGTRLQAGHWEQDKPKRCVLISESAGGSTDFYSPDFAFFNIQALSRAETYFQARDDAWAVFNALHGTSGWNMPNLESGPDYLAMTVEAIGLPAYLGVDDNRRHLFTCNFVFRVEEATCTG